MDEQTGKTNYNKNKNDKNKYKVYVCPICGSNILKLNKSRHNQTIKHEEAKYLWYDMVEMK